jgi:single-strand DNA-binding protein
MHFPAEGQAVARFSLATDRPAKPGTEPEPDWHQVVCFGKLAEFAGQYLSKGRLLFVTGRLTYRVWEAKDGQKRRTAEIVATQLIPLDRRPESAPASAGTEAEGDDLPF